ncbi:MAG: hypothetical protein KKF48_02055 [Nanoarchaeota archaeon]|nr:hypothetical protein [Nanoarchaeota archaeon]MBU1027804.1 hypothetical protein [Nanoarchaeota archaeon]
MNKLSALDKNIAECVGLWLAEGDNKTKAEITFTNNCWELIDLFYKTINKIFSTYNYNPRIYIYTPNGEKVYVPYKNCVVKNYIHKRATKPYFILRFASVPMVKKWKEIIKDMLNKKKLYPFILRGFFAGEGNIHESSHNRRVLRLAQKKQKDFINNILNELNLYFYFETGNRTYVIYRKPTWDLFAKFNLADLHPDKKEKFWRVYGSFKEEHYPTNYLIKEVYSILDNPFTTMELSEKFKRTMARMQDVLILLKKQGKINNFRVGSVGYWTRNKNLIIISKLKKEYLLFLDESKYTSECAKHFKVCWKSSYNRLKELEKLNLTRRENNGKWMKLSTKKNILAI